MRLVYWALAIGGFVLVVSWVWGALVAFSLTILLIIGYEIWRQSRPLTLSRRPRRSNLKSEAVEQSQAERLQLTDAAVQPAVKFQVRLVEEKPVQDFKQSNLAEQSTSANPSESARGGDRTVIQQPLTLVSEAGLDSDSDSDSETAAGVDAIQDIPQSNSTADLANAPTVIESLDQIRFADAAEVKSNKTDSADLADLADLVEEPTVQPSYVSNRAIAKPPQQPSPWDEPITTLRRLPSNSPSDSTVIRPHAATGESTVARPFRPSSFADEKTVIGPLKVKTGNEQTIAKPFPTRDAKTDSPSPRSSPSPQAADKAKISPLQSTDPEEPTVIGQQTQNLKQEEERTTL